LEDGLARVRLTKTQLAERAELGRTTVQQAFRPGGPVPSAETVSALAGKLGLPVQRLLELRRVAATENSAQPEAVEIAGAGRALVLGETTDLVLTYDETEHLRDILNGAMAPESIPALYYAATLHTSDPSRCPDDLWLAVETLRRIVSRRPLFDFLVRLASGPDTVTRERLWDWLHEVAPRHQIDLEQLKDLDHRLRPVTIQVGLEREYLGHGFEVTVLTYLGHEGRRVYASTSPQTWHDIGQAVGAAATEVAEMGNTPTSVEFRLPYGLLGAEVENLQIKLPDRQMTLGEWCPVVVRPSMRRSGPTSVALWERKWRDLLARGDRYDERAVRIVGTTDSVDASSLRDILCLGVKLDPGAGQEELARVLAVAIEAGIPLAIWHRNNDLRGPSDDALDRILRGRPLNQLPEVVHKQRKAARFPSARLDHPGRDVVLLWDDPGRIPPGMNWRAPRQEGHR
jgi:hypothetical protein